MTTPSHHGTIARLKALLETGGLAQKSRLDGLAMLRRLSGPVRVFVLGRDGAGKSSVINMLLGVPMIPSGIALPPITVSFGPEPRITLTDAGGDLVDYPDMNLSSLEGSDAQMIHVEAPVPILEHITLIEPVTSPADWPEFLAQLERRCDICLWCSRGFGDQARALWAQVPEAVKDHGFLVLTKADATAEAGQLDALMQVLAPVAAEEFHSIYPVAALQALAACQGGRITDPAAWAASGGAALAKAISDHAAAGRREDLDAADLFILRNETATPSPAPAVIAVPQPAAKPELAAGTADYCARAVTLLVGSAGQIAPLLGLTGKDDQSAILSQCVRVVEELADLFAPVAANGDITLLDDIQEAAEMITLLQLEGGSGPTADALALLAQLKSEFEDQIAA